VQSHYGRCHNTFKIRSTSAAQTARQQRYLPLLQLLLTKKKTPNLVLLHTQRSGRRSLQHNRKRRGSKSRIDQGKGDVPLLVLLALVIIAQQSQRRKQ
jgi:hypothetical protein